MRWLRRLYDWVLSWAETPYGVPALFCLAFVESSFFPVPPDLLLLVLCLSMPERSFWYAFVCLSGSVLGGLAGYGIGFALWEWVSPFFYSYVPGFSFDTFYSIQSLFKEYDFLIIFVAGFTPIPYKIITIGSGVFKINIFIFLFSSLISRGLRFYIASWLVKRFGVKIRFYIDKYFNLLTLIVTFLILLFLVVIKN